MAKRRRKHTTTALDLLARSLTQKVNYLSGSYEDGTLLDTLHNLGVRQIPDGLNAIAEAIRELAEAVRAHSDRR